MFVRGIKAKIKFQINKKYNKGGLKISLHKLYSSTALNISGIYQDCLAFILVKMSIKKFETP